jgi:hypothetical protein
MTLQAVIGHPLLKRLYKQHSVSLCFTRFIFYTSSDSYPLFHNSQRHLFRSCILILWYMYLVLGQNILYFTVNIL